MEGCGWIRVSPTGRQALLSYASCSRPGQAELAVVDLQDASRRELSFAKDAPSFQPFVYSPDGARAAYGLALGRGNPAGRAASGGIWLLDTLTLNTARLWQDAGLESWAIDWSPDGAMLLVASVEAQGLCGYYVVDVTSGEARQIIDATGCGANGTMVGFSALP